MSVPERSLVDMGYYTGNGEVVGGGTAISVFETFPWWGTHHIYQKTKTTRTRKAGVSLATATDPTNDGWCVMKTHTFSKGNFFYTSVNCYGAKRNSSYSQISGSNLYELTIEDESISANLDDGAWVNL